MTFDKLKTEIRGELVEPGDPKYDESRKVYNGMIDRKPKYIIYCENVRDVITAVNFGRENDIRTSIRGGGHHAAGMGVCDDGLVIDLSKIDYVHVDPYTKSAHVGGGATWGQVDHATHAFGLATPSGFISTTGVGGLTLGGGVGYLNRNYGLTIDNLISANVVLADGRFVTASADRNEDLFWALRGGGGNFGVVTSFKFKLHEVSEVYGGPMLWELEEAEEVMKWYREFIVNAPNTINGFFAFLVVPSAPPFPEHLHNKKMCGIVWCYSGRINRAEDAFKPIQDVRNIALDLTGPMPYPVFQRMFDDLLYSGLHMYWKADYMTELSDEAIQEHIKHGSTVPTLRSTMHMYPVNGVVHEVDKSETAWSYREANWAQVIVGVSPDPDDKEMITKWASDYWDALHPHSSGGAYINFMMEEGQDRVEASYGDNYSRLQKVKAKYDPVNFFHINQNIKPTK